MPEEAKLTQENYPDVKKTLGNFELDIKAGSFSTSQIIALLGENGIGKTTFIRIFAGVGEKATEVTTIF